MWDLIVSVPDHRLSFYFTLIRNGRWSGTSSTTATNSGLASSSGATRSCCAGFSKFTIRISKRYSSANGTRNR